MSNTNKVLPFLRFCLHDEPCPPKAWDEMDWEGLHEFALKQSLVGVIFRGVCRAGEAGARPPRQLMMRWLAESEQIRKRNARTNEAAVRLTERLLSEGFRSCILKGQGNALMYPDAGMRTPGDIDIWVEGSRKDILSFVRKYVPDAHLQYHHVDFPVFRDVPVEVHFMPSFFHNPLYNHRLQEYYRKEAAVQFANWTELPDDAGRVCVPTERMNRIFQMTHIMHHLVDEGVGLRQLMDYYYLLTKSTNTDYEEEWRIVSHLGMTRFAGGLMYALGELLGLPRERMSVPPDKRIGQLIIDEVLAGGNFGQYDERQPKTKGKAGVVMRMGRRICRMGSLLPGEMLFIPAFLLWHQGWKLANK